MRMIFVNLPVKNIETSRNFFTALGFSFNPEYSDDRTLCMIVEEEIDRMIATALASGGSGWKPVQDHGFMYAGSFQDPDGHVWELVHMTEQG